MSKSHRVIWIQETGEECYAFEGSLTACHNWIAENAHKYEEARGFYVEAKYQPRFDDWNDGGDGGVFDCRD